MAIILSEQRRAFIRRNPLEGHIRLFNDYFVDASVYPPNIFRRFRMNHDLFLRILNNVENHEPYFVQRRNVAGTLGLSSLQKVTATMRILAYGVGADLMDEYVCWGALTACTGNGRIVRLHGENLLKGHAPKVNYSINGHNYTMGYYLADGIYHSWSTFVKIIPTPRGRKRQLFASAQESTRKDVKRAFEILQARFAIIRGPARYFCQSVLKDIMMVCIILHNMIIKDERDSYLRAHDYDYDQEDDTNLEPISRYPTSQFVDFLQCHHDIRNEETHSQLQFDLIEHQWMLRGEE
ncbi:uncharacterized protein LOC121972292 [Zingiber officinale]|uniref:uncharacterized protein LOC121972292 n=1 Tax=Zingiber officinale TaxID=94328 RepID=UPI001C4C48E5|nr:uncharacterized protein LOC121972292 [Zingiber officinale]